MKRRELREHAFKLVFSERGKTLPEEAVEYYCSDNAITGKDKQQLIQKVGNVLQHLEEIDKAIGTHIKGYAFDRISRVSLAVLRLAVSEILYDDSVPAGVAISEAVAIAGTYEDEKSKAFVNGVLGSVYRGGE